MLITNEEDYESFKIKYSIEDLLEVDDTILKLWLIGNEIMFFEDETELYFMIAIDNITSDDKFRTIKLFNYDATTQTINDEYTFKVKNITIKENIDLFQTMFNMYYS